MATETTQQIIDRNLGYVEAMGKGLIEDGWATDHPWVVGLRQTYRAVKNCTADELDDMQEDVANWAETVDCDGERR